MESRTKAQWLIKNGHVLVNNVEVKKPGKLINNASEIVLKQEFPYVGRGGIKLEAALKEFSISVEDKICLDIGSSIGGFTDCLIKHGALKVHSVDMAIDLLHPSLKCEKMEGRVIPLLGIDAREKIELEEKIDVCTIDVTFTSLELVLPRIKNYLNLDGDIIALVKPIFETDFHGKSKFEIITDPEKLQGILVNLKVWGEGNGFFTFGLVKSPILGKGGSIEFFIHFRIDEALSKFAFKKKIDEILNNT